MGGGQVDPPKSIAIPIEVSDRCDIRNWGNIDRSKKLMRRPWAGWGITGLARREPDFWAEGVVKGTGAKSTGMEWATDKFPEAIELCELCFDR